jgi:DNA-binding MarR family transcriptional regulator
MNDKAVSRIREFTRFYTNIMGVLDKHILDSPFSLSEARVLYELNHMERCTARKIMQAIEIDEGYLSRILDSFIKRGLVKKTRSDTDRRAFILSVTTKGRSQFAKINQASANAVGNLIKKLPEKDIDQMISMMDGIQKILTNEKSRA